MYSVVMVYDVAYTLACIPTREGKIVVFIGILAVSFDAMVIILTVYRCCIFHVKHRTTFLYLPPNPFLAFVAILSIVVQNIETWVKTKQAFLFSLFLFPKLPPALLYVRNKKCSPLLVFGALEVLIDAVLAAYENNLNCSVNPVISSSEQMFCR